MPVVPKSEPKRSIGTMPFSWFPMTRPAKASNKAAYRSTLKKQGVFIQEKVMEVSGILEEGAQN